MKSLQLGKPLEVDIELSDPVPTDGQIEADLKGLMNLTAVSANTIASLRRVGVHAKRQGIIETQRGAAYVTQAWVLEICGELRRLMVSKTRKENADESLTDEACKIGDCFAKLVGKQAELISAMLSHEPKENNGHEPPLAPNAAFPAGAVVFGGNAQAHFHQTPPQKPIVTLPPEP